MDTWHTDSRTNVERFRLSFEVFLMVELNM